MQATTTTRTTRILRGGIAALAATAALTGLAEAVELELQVVGPAGRFDTGDQFDVLVSLKDVAPDAAAGFQAFITYDDATLIFVGGAYTDAPFGQPILGIAGVGGDIDLASGILLEGSGGDQTPTSDDATLVTLTFEAAVDGICLPDIAFREHFPPTRVTTEGGEEILPLELSEFPLPPCAADVNFSGSVDIVDLLTVLAAWQQECPGDINRDGVVSFTDLISLLSAWGPCPG